MNKPILWDDQADAPAVNPTLKAENAARLAEAMKHPNPAKVLAMLNDGRMKLPKPKKLPVRQAQVLAFIAENPKSYSFEAATVLGFKSGPVSTVISELCRGGYIDRIPDGYYNRKHSIITPKGRAYLAEQEGAA